MPIEVSYQVYALFWCAVFLFWLGGLALLGLAFGAWQGLSQRAAVIEKSKGRKGKPQG